MHIYTGLDYSYKWKQIIQTCIKEASKNPFTTYYVIVKDPSFMEETFLQYTDSLFNIEITTLSLLTKKLQVSKKSELTKIQKVLLLKKILENNKNNTLYQEKNIFSSIDNLLLIFDDFYRNEMKDISLDSLTSLTKEKVSSCHSLYQQFMESIPNTYTYSYLDTISITFTNQVFYIMEDSILDNKSISFVEKIAKKNTVYIIANYENDERLVQKTYQRYFSKYSSSNIINESSYSSFICKQLFSNDVHKYDKEHPFSIIKETNPSEEIKSICFSIYQNIIEKQMSYKDFAIYYPNTQYLELIQKTLTDFNLPMNSIPIPKEYPSITAIHSLLQYAFTKQDEDMIVLLDTLVLKRCNSFQQVNFYKKSFQETNTVYSDSYLELKEYIDSTYIIPLCNAITIKEITSIILNFIQDDLVYSEDISTITSYFSTFNEYEESITLIDY
ncbi:MAG: hypothetical protein ACK5LC_11560, partial [Coprobacillaceae bacterium]